MTRTMFTRSFLAPAPQLAASAANEADSVGGAGIELGLARRCAG